MNSDTVGDYAMGDIATIDGKTGDKGKAVDVQKDFAKPMDMGIISNNDILSPLAITSSISFFCSLVMGISTKGNPERFSLILISTFFCSIELINEMFETPISKLFNKGTIFFKNSLFFD